MDSWYREAEAQDSDTTTQDHLVQQKHSNRFNAMMNMTTLLA